MAASIGRVLITGTTSGLGGALLEYYVKCGAEVISVNRRRVSELESRYPSVRFECADVRKAEEVEKVVETLAAAGELPDVFILNAGINRVDNDESFDLESYTAVLDTNLYGVLNFVGPLTKHAAGPRARHIVAISSMVNYVGNPYALGYHTSKRALTGCFDVWSRMYAGTDLIFQQVLLGPVHTPMYTMADQFPRWMVRVKDVFSASLEGTVRAIARFAQTRRKTLFYPWRAVILYFGVWLLRLFLPGFFRGKRTLGGSFRRLKLGRTDAGIAMKSRNKEVDR